MPITRNIFSIFALSVVGLSCSSDTFKSTANSASKGSAAESGKTSINSSVGSTVSIAPGEFKRLDSLGDDGLTSCDVDDPKVAICDIKSGTIRGIKAGTTTVTIKSKSGIQQITIRVGTGQQTSSDGDLRTDGDDSQEPTTTGNLQTPNAGGPTTDDSKDLIISTTTIPPANANTPPMSDNACENIGIDFIPPFGGPTITFNIALTFRSDYLPRKRRGQNECTGRESSGYHIQFRARHPLAKGFAQLIDDDEQDFASARLTSGTVGTGLTSNFQFKTSKIYLQSTLGGPQPPGSVPLACLNGYVSDDISGVSDFLIQIDLENSANQQATCYFGAAGTPAFANDYDAAQRLIPIKTGSARLTRP